MGYWVNEIEEALASGETELLSGEMFIDPMDNVANG